MASATGWEAFQGSDPEGSPPVKHQQGIGAMLREREAAQGCPTAWCLQYCQAYDTCSLHLIAEEIAETAGSYEHGVACVCAPGVFITLREAFPDLECVLLDFNPQLQEVGSEAFALYDYTCPQNLPQQLRHRFDVVVADTPVQTETCALDILQTMQLLTRSVAHPRHYLLTQAALHSSVWEDLGMRPAKFRPRRKTHPHTSAILYTNVRPSQRLLGWESEPQTPFTHGGQVWRLRSY